MMTPERPEPPEEHPTDELSPQLRQVVQRIAAGQPPEELVRRSLERARSGRPLPGRRPSRRLWYVAALAAACIAGVLLVWQLRSGDGDAEIVEEPTPPEKVPAPEEPVRQPCSLPTWRTYYQAARQSPEALEALLDEHAEQLALSEPESRRFGLLMGFQEETL